MLKLRGPQSFVKLSAGIRGGRSKTLSYIFLPNKLPKPLRLEPNKKLYNLIVSESQASGRGLAGCFWLSLSQKVAIKLLPGDLVLSSLDCFEEASLPGLSAQCLCSLLACQQKALVPHHLGHPTRCLSLLLTWQLAMSDLRAERMSRCFS